jgi:ParB family transcriptional regulator, chromosome partitioning protein
VVKKKTSVEDTIDKFFKEKREQNTGDLFDASNFEGLVNISLSRIAQDKNQPRKTFNDKTIKELADSIKEQGIINPITVRPYGKKFVIIAGERRFLAARLAGLKTVPAVIRKVSKNDVMLISLIENLQREDLNSIDRAEGIKSLKVNLGLPWTEVARKLGLSKQRVLDLVGLLSLPGKIKEDIRNKKLTEKHGRALRKLKGRRDEVVKVSKIIKDKKLSGDDTLKLAKEVKTRFGSLKLDDELDNFKTGPVPSPSRKVIKVCKDLLKEIKNAAGSSSFHQKMTVDDKKELKDILLTVIEKINDFINTYNL